MKLLWIFFLFSFNLYSSVDDYQCLVENFSTTVSHKGKPFGLFKTKIKIDKQGCVITIDHEKYKYLKNHWVVDTCREPVHIKQGSGSLEVIKREGVCGESNTDYCESLNKILSVIQDDGLIFAPGEKENLKSDHGKFYCSFLLLKRYLKEGVVLKRSDNTLKLLIELHKPYIKQKDIDNAPRVDSPKSLEERKKDPKTNDPAISF